MGRSDLIEDENSLVYLLFQESPLRDTFHRRMLGITDECRRLFIARQPQFHKGITH